MADTWFRASSEDSWHSGVAVLCDGCDSERAVCGLTLERDASRPVPIEGVCTDCLRALLARDGRVNLIHAEEV